MVLGAQAQVFLCYRLKVGGWRLKKFRIRVLQSLTSSIYQSLPFAFLPQTSLSWKQTGDTVTVPIDKGSGLPLSLDQYFETNKPMATVHSYGKREGKFFRPTRYFYPLVSNSPERGDILDSGSDVKGDE